MASFLEPSQKKLIFSTCIKKLNVGLPCDLYFTWYWIIVRVGLSPWTYSPLVTINREALQLDLSFEDQGYLGLLSVEVKELTLISWRTSGRFLPTQRTTLSLPQVPCLLSVTVLLSIKTEFNPSLSAFLVFSLIMLDLSHVISFNPHSRNLK